VRKEIFFLTIFFAIVFLLNTADASKSGDEQTVKESTSVESNLDRALSFLRGQISGFGLVKSYVEEKDDFSYTYDNSLAVMAFMSAGDMVSAKKILDAFTKISQQESGGFLDKYNSQDGSISYGASHNAGPNAYLLQAMNLYYAKTGDESYYEISRKIADFLIGLQDDDGGIFGRNGVSWKSTENNLGIFVGIYNFGVLYKSERYIEKADMIKSFLEDECWNTINFLCGEGDFTEVTDSQSLGVLVFGEKYSSGLYWLYERTVNTKQFNDNTKVTGFDCNNDRDTIWTEVTLQMTLAFLETKDISAYNKFKAECEKLIHPSGALLLTSNVGSTGFGWTLQKWQAVAPTAWYIFVCNKDNVLKPMYKK